MEKDYKKMYEELLKDVRENATYDICEICAHGFPPCTEGDAECALECDICTKKCPCHSCEKNNQWKWRGEDKHATE